MTVEKRIGDEATGIYSGVIDDGKWFTVTLVEILEANEFAFELVGIQTLHVASMVLVEVCEFIVEENAGVELCGDVEINDTLALSGDICYGAVGRVVEEGVSWCGGPCIAIGRAQAIGEFI